MKIDTKTKLLDAAEQLFSQKGFRGASHREITLVAAVNLAAVNYHFRSKEALIRAVIKRRADRINAERLAALDHAEMEADGAPVPTEVVLDAFFRPAIEDSSACSRGLLGRIWADADRHRDFVDLIMPVMERFAQALRRSLKEPPDEDLYWKLHFSVSVLVFTMEGWQHLERLSGGLCTLTDAKGTIRRMVEFVNGGLRASRKQEG